MKTHDELGLTEGEHASMIEIRDLFLNDAIEHSPTNVELPRGSAFYMGHACFRTSIDETSSGALMCIGGWIKAFDLGLVDVHDTYETEVTDEHVGVISDFVSEAEGEICRLFNPDIPWRLITPRVAAMAIDAFLANGSVNWKSYVAH